MMPSPRSVLPGPAGWLAGALAGLLFGAPALSQPALPSPGYASSVHLLFNAPHLNGTEAEFEEDVRAMLSVTHGPYARVGAYIYATIHMPWTQNLANPTLWSPSAASLNPILQRLESRGLEFHLALLGGMSRSTWTYDPAFIEDRRNAQWYGDGTILKSSPAMPSWAGTYASASRYARKLRRHMEAKNRAAGRLLVSLRKAYPETFVSASGDGEAELNLGGLDYALPYEQQAIADYSPFAILEFRDWIRHTGLYADGAPFEGQGFESGGAPYQGDSGLGAFNAAFGTTFTSWNLRYFDWSPDDPIDGDPKAIPATAYNAAGWSPLPTSGPEFIDGGFDAPRSWNVPSAAFWELWLRFRQEMLHHYVSDFADWITTSPDGAGTTFEEGRFFTHQIPADYLSGRYPGHPDPAPRLLTSASTLDAAVPRHGRIGLTVFDVFDGTRTWATSQYLVPEIRNRNVPSWGLMEYNPSWPEGGNDPDVAGIQQRFRTAVEAGAHVVNFHTWDHFFSAVYTANFQAFSAVMAQHLYQPRDAATTAYAPPPVSGVEGRHVKDRIALTWSTELRFPEGDAFEWTSWPDFSHYEVWAGPTPDFDTTSGRRLGSAFEASFESLSLRVSDRYFKVRAISTRAVPGALSAAWSGGFYTVLPCRVLDTRETTGPSAGAPAFSPYTSRVIQIANTCGIPANASSVSANLTVVDPTAAGSIRAVPGDETPTKALASLFRARRTVANNVILTLASDGSGTALVRNDSPGDTHVIIDVNGFNR